MNQAVTIICSIIGALTGIIGTTIAVLEYRRKAAAESAKTREVPVTPAPRERPPEKVPAPLTKRQPSLVVPVVGMLGLLALGTLTIILGYCTGLRGDVGAPAMIIFFVGAILCSLWAGWIAIRRWRAT
jgi:hypothetical protein